MGIRPLSTFILFLGLIFLSSYGTEVELLSSLPKKIEVSCFYPSNCRIYEKQINLIQEHADNLQIIRDYLRILAKIPGTQGLKFWEDKKKRQIKVFIKNSLRINDLRIVSKNAKALSFAEDYVGLLKNRDGEFFDERMLKSDVAILKKNLFSHGFLDVDVKVDRSLLKKDGQLNLFLSVKKTRNPISLNVSCKDTYIKNNLETLLLGKISKGFKLKDLKQIIDEYRESVVILGYPKISFTVMRQSKSEIEITCARYQKYAFSINDKNNYFLKEKFRKKILGLMASSDTEREVELLTDLVKEEMFKAGYYDFKVNVEFNEQDATDKVSKRTVKESKLEQHLTQRFFRVSIKRGHRRVLGDVTFQGNRKVSNEVLLRQLKDLGIDIDDFKYSSEENLEALKNYINKAYIALGFLNVRVKYSIKVSKIDHFGGESISVVYYLNEGKRTLVKNIELEFFNTLGERIEFDRISLKWIDEIFLNKKRYFNPIRFEEALTKLIERVKEEGFENCKFIGEIESFVQFSSSQDSASIKISVVVEPEIEIQNIQVFGLVKTRKKYINRVVQRVLKDTPKQQLEPVILNELYGTNLFSNVRVIRIPLQRKDLKQASSTLNRSKKVNLAYLVRERKYGVVELAPGFRNDLGLKLSTKYNLLNLNGENESLSVEATVNRRISQTAFDQERQAENKHLVEYELETIYRIPDILNSYWDYSLNGNLSRTRFFSFDADIYRIANGVSKKLTRRLAFDLTHQYERVRQFDISSDDNDSDLDDEFTIGTLIPSLSVDYRDNKVLPRKGYFGQLSFERAHPMFLSRSSDQYAIDYYKMTLRNRFYFPVTQFSYLAVSIASGVQRNMARETAVNNDGTPQSNDDGSIRRTGYVPSLKVFRLTGIDTVRGYAEDEVNFVENGLDVGDVLVQDKVYMTSLKVEPRFLLNDSMIASVFFDAGRIQVQSYEPNNLKLAAGVGFKYVTPVGTIDIDYGFKLKRRETAAGKDSPGRLHLSIGFF